MKSAISGSFPPCAPPPRLNPPRVSSSGRPGACITPSRVTWLMTVSFLMAAFLSGRGLSFLHERPPPRSTSARMAAMATVVAFHAHPDDEVLLTGGTLARLAVEGQRTVVVVACCGGLGRGAIADPETRLAELLASAARLGVAGVVHLGYADSGHGPV